MVTNTHDGSMRVDESREDARKVGLKHGVLTGVIVEGTLNGTKCVGHRSENSMTETKVSSKSLKYGYLSTGGLKYAILVMSDGFVVTGSSHGVITMCSYEVGADFVADAV